jgi:hypothetical protein
VAAVFMATAVLAATAFGSGGSVRGRELVRTAGVSEVVCSKATATQLVNEHHLNSFLLHDPVRQVLCGAFTGPHSQAMAIAIAAPTCWGIQRWAVFHIIGSAWQLAPDRHEFVFLPLVAVGGDIRVTSPVFRPGDPRCLPSGGKHARVWHWNGTRFVAGAWKQVTPGVKTTPSRSGASSYFRTPTGNIVCFHAGARPGPALVLCGIKSGLKPAPPRRSCTEGEFVSDRVELRVTGRTEVPSCAGDPGPFVGLHVGAHVLGYGKTWSGSGLRCTSAIAGLTCRNRSRHGFFLSRAHWRSF